MKDFLRDLHYSGRLLAKSITFTTTVVLSLGIGIGANAAIFSFISGVLLKPLPFKDSDRLVRLWEQPAKNPAGFAPVSGANFKDWKAQSRLFDSLSAFTSRKEATLTGTKSAERVGTRRVSGDFFATFQVAPKAGRWFLNAELDIDEPHVAIISDALWRRQFAAHEDVIGKEIVLDREVFKVVGVSPSIFELMGHEPVDIMLPLRLNSKEMLLRDMHLLSVIGLLKPGVTLAEAQSQMDVIAARLAELYSNVKDASSIKVLRPGGLTVLWYRGLFGTLQAAVLFVLLIACTNVASLLLARWTGRQQELAIRAALGATRWSTLRLSLCESLILVAGGSMLGIWFADIFRRAALSVAPPDIPRIGEVQIDATVLFGIIALSACIAVFFTVVPWLFSRRIEINNWLRQGIRSGGAGRGREKWKAVLLVAQVALTIVLLAGAGLFIRSLWRLQKIDLGFDPKNLLTFRLLLDNSRYRTPEQNAAFYSMVLERVKAIPGVQETCVASHPPFSGEEMGNPVAAPGQIQNSHEQIAAQTIIVSPEYFRTLGIKIVQGRSFTDSDRLGAPTVVVINETMARRFSPSESPLGKLLELGEAQWPDPDNVQPRTAQIVGVVGDNKQYVITAPSQNVVYVPFEQSPAPAMFVIAKTLTPIAGLVDSVRRNVSEVDPDQPIYNVMMMQERIRVSQAERHFNATLLVLFAALALVATAIGIYGTVAFWVAQRTHEIGLRMALGADRGQIVLMIFGKIIRLMAIALVLGIPASLGLVRVVRSLVYQGQPAGDIFYGVSDFDPLTMLLVLSVLVGSASLATFVPAWRATRIDPARVLQTE